MLTVEDYYGLGYRLTSQLLELSREGRHRLLVSYHPIFPSKIDGLLYPDTGLCILVGYGEPAEGGIVRSLHLRRYAKAEALRGLRAELRHVRTLEDSLTEAALRELASASEAHFALERIYAEAMDFGAKEAYTEEFCERIGV